MERSCPYCNHDNYPIGVLGSRMHYSCCACGMQYDYQQTDSIIYVQLSTCRSLSRITDDYGNPLFSLADACVQAEQEFPNEWEYVCNDEEKITREQYLLEYQDIPVYDTD